MKSASTDRDVVQAAVLTDQLSKPRRTDILVILTLLVGALIVYALVWPSAPIMTPDGYSYVRLAHDLRNLTLSELSLRTPGLPLLLILTDSTERVGKAFYIASLLLHFSSVGIVAYLLYVVGISRRMILAVVIVGILPPYVEPSTYVASETLSQFTIVVVVASLCLWMMTLNRWYFLATVATLAFAGLVRPTYEMLVLVLVTCVFICYRCRLFGRVDVWSAKLFAVVSLFLTFGIQFGWSTINYGRFGYFGTTRMTPIALSTKTADLLEYLPDEYADLRDLLIPYRDQNLIEPFRDHTGKDYIYRAMPAVVKYYNGDMIAATKHLKGALSYLVLHKPMSYLSSCFRSFGLFWTPNDCQQCGTDRASRGVTDALQLIVSSLFFLQAALGVGLVMVAGSSKALGVPVRFVNDNIVSRGLVMTYVLGVVVVVYTAVISCCFGTGEPRYRQTVDLLMLATCAVGTTIWRELPLGNFLRFGSDPSGNRKQLAGPDLVGL
jgi:hypothetical protein